jgi:hypothetical protein
MMRIILHKLPHSRKPTQGPTRFIPMQHTKLRHPNWKLAVTPVFARENDTVTRTVHGLQRPFLLLDV